MLLPPCQLFSCLLLWLRLLLLLLRRLCRTRSIADI